MKRRSRTAILVLAPIGALVLTSLALAELPSVPVPAENPITEPKRVLGKLLFWEEQLSSDNSMACGTCHIPANAGADSRLATHPGLDGRFGGADDVVGSAGVVRVDDQGALVKDGDFGLGVRVTGRAANPAIMAQYVDELFWDGRATSEFVDPETGQVSIVSGGALESQVVGPPLSDVEMAHEGRDWAAITAKLVDAVPMALATDLPTDMATAIAGGADYPALFEAAFGDDEITAERIAFAIATYERTLVPDQTPWDRFRAGETTAMTAAQTRGWNAFQNNATSCNECHEAPLFTDGSFRNIGVRPIVEDTGRQAVTDDTADRGKFKVPSLRNVGLKRTFMHNGEFTTLAEVLRFYADAPGTVQFTENQDRLMAGIRMPPPVQADIVAFLSGALTDPRVAAETFPFDRPTLASERTVNPSRSGAGRIGTGGRVPAMITPAPPNLGNADFVLGVDRGTPGATARLVVSANAPVGGELLTGELLGPVTLDGAGAGEGYASLVYPIPADSSRQGDVLYFQWRIDDAAAVGGVALSQVAVATLTGEAFEDLADSLPAESVIVTPPEEEPEDPEEPDDTFEPDVVGDASLYLSSGSFTVDWKRHDRDQAKDKLGLVGRISTAGASTLGGAQVTLTVGDVVLVDGLLLDENGRASVKDESGRKTKVQLSSSGAYKVALSGADLPAALGLTVQDVTTSLRVPVTLRVAGVGLDTDESTGEFAFAVRHRAARSAKGRFKLGRESVAASVFGVRKAKFVRKGLGHVLGFSGAVALPQGTDATPIDDVLVTVGDADTITVPLAALLLTDDGFRYSSRLLPVAGIKSFALDLSKGRFTLVTYDVDGIGLPTETLMEADVPLRIEFETAAGGLAFETTLAVTRRSQSSKTWKQ